MKGNPFRHVQPGDRLRIPAALYNTQVDMAQAWRAGAIAPGSGRLFQYFDSARDLGSSIVRVRNDSQEVISAHSAMGIAAMVGVDTAAAFCSLRPVPPLSVVLPDPKAHDRRFCITLDPIRPGKVGRAVVAGLALAKLEQPNGPMPAAMLVPGSTVLTATPAGGAGVVIADAPGDDADPAATSLALVSIGTGPRTFPALVGAASPDGANRWTYSIQATAGKAGPGYSDAFTTLGAPMTARNWWELGGFGIDLAALPPGFALKPAPEGSPVEVGYEWVTDGELPPVLEWWFTFPNAVDGACP